MIDIAWSDHKDARAARSDRDGTRRWGPERWKYLRRRLASLQAAPTLTDLDGVPGNFHALVADRRGQFAMTITASLRLVFEPDHEPLPVRADGGIDRARVTAVRIVEIADYHGK